MIHYPRSYSHRLKYPQDCSDQKDYLEPKLIGKVSITGTYSKVECNYYQKK